MSAPNTIYTVPTKRLTSAAQSWKELPTVFHIKIRHGPLIDRQFDPF